MPADPQRQVYANPPIEEALCQVIFREPLAWSVATPGRLYAELESSYPVEPEAQDQLEATIQLQPQQNNLALARTNQRFIYRDASKKRLLTVNAEQLSVNSLRPYETWPRLRERLRDALIAVNRVTPLTTISQVNLRYINRIEVPPTRIDSDDYFNMVVHTADSGKATFRAFINRVESILEPDEVVAITTFATTPTSGSEIAFLLDLDFQRPGLELTSVEDVLTIADDLKRLEDREFETLITDKTRELFK